MRGRPTDTLLDNNALGLDARSEQRVHLASQGLTVGGHAGKTNEHAPVMRGVQNGRATAHVQKSTDSERDTPLPEGKPCPGQNRSIVAAARAGTPGSLVSDRLA